MKKFVGIDISKETLDIYFEQEGKGQCQQVKRNILIPIEFFGIKTIKAGTYIPDGVNHA
jgi:hypothetical protein